MKSYKEKYLNLLPRIDKLYKSFNTLKIENESRATVIKNQNLFDPVIFVQTVKDLSLAIEGLQAIVFLNPTSAQGNIAKEVLHQLQKNLKELKDETL